MITQESSGGADTLNALAHLVEILVKDFGVGWTVVFMVSIALFFTAWRLYNDWKERREVNEALKEKENSIQRLASEARMYRAIFFRQQGFSEAEIERFILRNEFNDAPSARKSLESPSNSHKNPSIQPTSKQGDDK